VDRASFSIVRHGLLPLVGAAVAIYGIWESIKPGQGFPADRYWIFVLLYVVLAAAGAAVAIGRRRANHEALARGLGNARRPSRVPLPEAAVLNAVPAYGHITPGASLAMRAVVEGPPALRVAAGL
jgi:hypothetical protein